MELACVTTTDLNNPDVGDLRLSDLGDIVLLTALAAEVSQRLTVRLNFFRGEWFLDQREGTPYYETILVKSPSDRIIRAVFGQVIRGTEGVAALEKFSYVINSRTRSLSINFQAKLVDGSTLRSTDFQPFVVVYA
jgi:hypothetical protein